MEGAPSQNPAFCTYEVCTFALGASLRSQAFARGGRPSQRAPRHPTPRQLDCNTRKRPAQPSPFGQAFLLASIVLLAGADAASGGCLFCTVHGVCVGVERGQMQIGRRQHTLRAEQNVEKGEGVTALPVGALEPAGVAPPSRLAGGDPSSALGWRRLMGRQAVAAVVVLEASQSETAAGLHHDNPASKRRPRCPVHGRRWTRTTRSHAPPLHSARRSLATAFSSAPSSFVYAPPAGQALFDIDLLCCFVPPAAQSSDRISSPGGRAMQFHTYGL
ncbi:uncharacterized protein BDZ99DRAFT_520527 [Mytilinidion resinicola]|uniref:Uncharacterized protein n=1 Tax=Mytilinidion resinicola TaxID=574789 RepID=A0A6A6YPK8_9PEZI|nr:uncharacterized protein BDZ99DRAFT_520527 [Mytilinidion resinicola]KAF2810458.1 hypothetical protein BDZ99DRAFT_520527 [Mytilinidion resinicola]